MGVQVFLTTHNYFFLKEIDLRMKKNHDVIYHSLFREEKASGVISNSTREFAQINPNAISDTLMDVYDRDIDRAIGRKRRQ